MGTAFHEIYDAVIAKIEDYTFAQMSDEDAYEILSDYLRPAIAKFTSRREALANRDDHGFRFDLTDGDIEVLAGFMVVEYIDANYINIPSLLQQTLASKDFQVFSQANHLKGLLALRNSILAQTKQLMRDLSYEDDAMFRRCEYKQGYRQFKNETGC